MLESSVTHYYRAIAKASSALSCMHRLNLGSKSLKSPVTARLFAHKSRIYSTKSSMVQVSDVPHASAAWEWFRSIGSPAWWVAPMVDQSELAFRELCRKHGSTAAYTPMLHARLFKDGHIYRKEMFTTCPWDRPLLAQFCANDPDILLAAARYVEDQVDGVDINLGCPQRIAKKGKYGAYLMDDIDLVERMVRKLADNLTVPVTVKIRRFPNIEDTVDYAKRLEAAGASLLAIHGRTREQKRAKEVLADWEVIKAVKAALTIPVLANGNIRDLADAYECMKYTGADGVLSAESLLEDPALYSQRRLQPGGAVTFLDGPRMAIEYVDQCRQHTTPWRMVKGHLFKLLGPWLSEYTDLRDELNIGKDVDLDRAVEMCNEIMTRAEESGRDYPIPQISARKLAKMEEEAAKKAAIEEQERQADALKEIEQRGAEQREGKEQNTMAMAK